MRGAVSMRRRDSQECWSVTDDVRSRQNAVAKNFFGAREEVRPFDRRDGGSYSWSAD
jgi:hypothetical protein